MTRSLLQVLWGLQILVCAGAIWLHISGFLYSHAQLQVLYHRRLNGVFRAIVKRSRRSSVFRLAAKTMLIVVGGLGLWGVTLLPERLDWTDLRAIRGLVFILLLLLLTTILTTEALLDYRDRGRITDLAIAEPLIGLEENS